MSFDRAGRLVVYPIAEIFHAVPVRVLDANVDDAALGAEVRGALEARVDPETALDEHRAELRKLGLTLSELDSSPSVSVSVERNRLELLGWRDDGRPAGDEPVRVYKASDEAIGRAVRELLRSLGGATQLPEGPLGAPFGYKLAWLAIRASDPSAVVEALGLAATEPAEWETGVERAYDERVVFVSPRTGGWVFALHFGWADDPPDLGDLSDRLATDVQHFATHRVPELHVWQRAEGGRVTRAFRYVGESGEAASSGEPTEIERRLGFDWTIGDEGEAPDVDEFPDEETVMQVAGEWSIDPRTLGSVASESATGVVGFLPGR